MIKYTTRQLKPVKTENNRYRKGFIVSGSIYYTGKIFHSIRKLFIEKFQGKAIIILIIKKGGDYISVSDAKRKANKKWDEKNLTRISLALPKEEAARIEKYCIEHEISKNNFFKIAALEKMERDK